MKRFSNVCLIALIALVGFGAFPAQAQRHIPMLTVLVLDASGSISDRDFDVQKAAAIRFMVTSHELSRDVYSGERSDWVAVSFFGDDNLYAGIPFFNVNRENDLVNASRNVLGYRHPKSGGTAIYTAILKGALEVEQKYMSLPGHYIRNIIVVTDGQDNSRHPDARRLVEGMFPNRDVNLFLIGVGRDARIDQFRNVADRTEMIDNYNELVAALLAARHALSNR